MAHSRILSFLELGTFRPLHTEDRNSPFCGGSWRIKCKRDVGPFPSSDLSSAAVIVKSASLLTKQWSPPLIKKLEKLGCLEYCA